MVFGDKYGRETPVFTNGYVDGVGEENNIALTGNIYTDKSLSATKNKFTKILDSKKIHNTSDIDSINVDEVYDLV